MAAYYIKVDRNCPDLIKALIKYSAQNQNYYAQKLQISPSNLSAYLNGSKKMSKKLCDDILALIGFDPEKPFILINKNIL